MMDRFQIFTIILIFAFYFVLDYNVYLSTLLFIVFFNLYVEDFGIKQRLFKAVEFTTYKSYMKMKE